MVNLKSWKIKNVTYLSSENFEKYHKSVQTMKKKRIN